MGDKHDTWYVVRTAAAYFLVLGGLALAWPWIAWAMATLAAWAGYK